jgi:hypothetical protein
MSTYRFINADHSLVLRDDHVIAWDAALDQPQQIDEQRLWRDGGSPTPTMLSGVASGGAAPGARRSAPGPFSDNAMTTPMPPQIANPLADAAKALDAVEAELAREPNAHDPQLRKLAEVVHALVEVGRGYQRPPPREPTK